MITRVTTTYARVKVTAVTAGPCPVCGRRVRRSRVFSQTVNPWNRNAATGRPRTPHEVQLAVEQEAADWRRIADLCHEKCKMQGGHVAQAPGDIG